MKSKSMHHELSINNMISILFRAPPRSIDDIMKHLNLHVLSEEALMRMQLKSDDVYGGCNVKGDGNCGWRSASLILYETEDNYAIVKQCMLAVLRLNSTFYKDVLGVGYKKLKSILSKTGDVGSGDWFETLDCPVLLAETYNRPVVVYGSAGFQMTYLPYLKEPEKDAAGNMIDVEPIVLLLRAFHFNAIVIKPEAVTRISWPRLFPGYAQLIVANGLSRKWLDLYSSRCVN